MNLRSAANRRRGRVASQAAGTVAMAWLLAGCGSAPVKPVNLDAQRRAEFDKSMDRWHGASTKELVAKLGAPSTRSKLADGTLVYAYAKSTQVHGPIGPIPFVCVVRYLVDDHTGLIVGHRIEGC